jgi:hypothetical protein
MKLSIDQQNVARQLAGLDSRDDLKDVEHVEPVTRKLTEISRVEQLGARAMAGLLTERELPELEALLAQDRNDSADRQRLEELEQSRLAGLMDKEKYTRRLLLETVGRKKKQVESDDPKEKRAALWEKYYRHEITLDQCLAECAAIRLEAEGRGVQFAGQGGGQVLQ